MQRKSVSFDQFTQNVLDVTSSHCKLTYDELTTSKKKEVVNARSIVAVILRDGGTTYQSIADILKVDVSGAHAYVQMHQSRLSDKSYSLMYSKVLKSIESIESIDGDIHSKVNNLLVRLEKVENRVNHLTSLLTS